MNTLAVVTLAALTVSQIRDAVERNQAVFSQATMICEWTETVPDSYRQSIELEIAYVNKLLEDPSIRRTFAQNFSSLGGMAPGQSLEDAVASRLRSEIASSGFTCEYTFVAGERLQVEQAEQHDDRRRSAEKRGITAFTPSGKKVIQQTNDGRWLCLEPFPLPQGMNPIAWKKSKLEIRSVLPPGWGDETVVSAYSHGIVC